MKNVVVTGANGFVGCEVVKHLVDYGYYVFAVIREGSEPKAALINDNVTVIRCDMNNYSNLHNLIGSEVELFYHFAWVGTAGPLRADETTQLQNVQYACDAVRAAVAVKAKRFILASSIMEYEISQKMEKGEAVSINNQYSTAKLSARYMSRLLASSLGIEFVSGIISNIYGPGEFSPRLINSSIRKLLRGERASFSSGTQKYDFIYIYDAAEIFVLIGVKGTDNSNYYVGNPEIIMLKDYLMRMGVVLGKEELIGIGDIATDGSSLDYNVIDTYKVSRELGYNNKISFEDGILMTTKWIVSQDSK